MASDYGHRSVIPTLHGDTRCRRHANDGVRRKRGQPGPDIGDTVLALVALLGSGWSDCIQNSTHILVHVRSTAPGAWT